MKFCAGGDLVIQANLPEQHKGTDELREFITKADARIVNLEVPIVDKLCYGSTFSGGPPLCTKPYAVDIMRRYGFQACGCANNHSFDYGIGGLEQTMDCLDKAGFLRAGIGRSLDEATAPATIPTAKGNVAYIAVYTSYWENDSMRAGYAHGDIPARPGVNALRRTDECLVTPEEMEFVKDLASRTLVNAEEDMEAALGYGRKYDGTFTFGTVKFRESDHTGRFSRPNETDTKRIEREIKNAKMCHEYCVVSAHSHQFRGRLEHETDYFLEEFAHRCIDAGADAFVGTGTHMPKAIEIYKGKPIFYCVGNFIFQGLYVNRLTSDFIEGLGYPADMRAQEVFERQHSEASHSMEDFPIYYMGIVPRWEMENDKVTKIELMPIEMGMKEPMGLKGFPSPMEPQRLMEHMKMVCEPYGTKLKISGDVIEVVLD